MEVAIHFDSDDPPCGFVRCAGDEATGSDCDDEPSLRFSGWIGLLAALTELTQPAD